MRDKSLLIISKSPPCAQEGDLVKFTSVWRTGSSVGQSGGLIIPWSWVQVPPGPPTMLSWSWSWKLENGTLPELLELQLETPTSLLHEDLPRLVVPGLPNADDSAVRLNLVDIFAGNPDLLRRVDRSRNDRRGHHGSRNDGSRDDARADDCISQNAANNPADEPRPEMSPSMSPATVVMVVVLWRRHRAVVHHWRGASTEAAAMAKAAARTAEARARTSHKRSRRQNCAKYKYHLLVHFVFPFSAFAVT